MRPRRWACVQGPVVPCARAEGARLGARSGLRQADERLTTLERLLATASAAARSGRARQPAGRQHRSRGRPPSRSSGRCKSAGRTRSSSWIRPTTSTRPALRRCGSSPSTPTGTSQDGQRCDEQRPRHGRADSSTRQTVPTVRRSFGTEWPPGIDGDPRMTIFLGTVPGVAAYFSSWDEYPRSVYRFSNEREMIHVNLGVGQPGVGGFRRDAGPRVSAHGPLAPEPPGRHLAGRGVRRAGLVAGRAPGSAPSTGSFQRQPDVQLTTWSQGRRDRGALPGVLPVCALPRAAVRARAPSAQLLSEKARAPESITAYLSRAGHGVTFDDVFEDWIVANLLDDPAVGDGRYAHDGIEHRARSRPHAEPERPARRPVGAPVRREVRRASGDRRRRRAALRGRAVRAAGRHRRDERPGALVEQPRRRPRFEPDASLRPDRRHQRDPSLQPLVRHRARLRLLLRPGLDRWRRRAGRCCTAPTRNDANPTGNAIGPGYSGKSGAAGGQRSEPAWIPETVDLTPFAGREVLVRFEYVTDQGYNARGVLRGRRRGARRSGSATTPRPTATGPPRGSCARAT